LQIGAAALLTATSTAVDISGDFVVDPNLVRFASGAGFSVLFASVAAMLVVVVVTSALAFRTSVVPRWLGWFGGVAVVLAVLEALLLPIFVVPVWVLVVSVVLLMPSRVPEFRREGAAV
jgi:hypothetical protein